MTYLKTYISKRKNSHLSYQSQKKILDTLKSVIKWGQLYLPNEVPKSEIFTGNEYRSVNSKLSIDFFSDDVVKKINTALKDEKNVYIKCGIIILQSTGIRVGDMLRLTIDCLIPHSISGMTLVWYDYKNRKKRQPMPITHECASAIKELIEHTKFVREEIDEKYKRLIFIHNNKHGKGATNISHGTFGSWLKFFVINHNIKDNDGKLISLTAHKFRRTLATDMLSKGINTNIIQDVLGHSTPGITKQYYADIKDEERAKIFRSIGIIGNINLINENIVPDKDELAWFRQNKDKGARMCDGYCTKPFNNGEICDRLLKRKKCYTCSRYITTPEYLDVHKSYLKDLEEQIKNNIYGEHYAEHFISTINVLKEIIRNLEVLTIDNANDK
ncbi:tyrosine-type recombinase/integrase [Clostridium botulinum]|nr:tyrosine-type recombinase/integrase [Clostridium botulinum]